MQLEVRALKVPGAQQDHKGLKEPQVQEHRALRAHKGLPAHRVREERKELLEVRALAEVKAPQEQVI